MRWAGGCTLKMLVAVRVGIPGLVVGTISKCFCAWCHACTCPLPAPSPHPGPCACSGWASSVSIYNRLLQTRPDLVEVRGSSSGGGSSSFPAWV